MITNITMSLRKCGKQTSECEFTVTDYQSQCLDVAHVKTNSHDDTKQVSQTVRITAPNYI